MLTQGEPGGALRSQAEVESALGKATPPVARAIEGCLQGRDPAESQVVQLFNTGETDYRVLLKAADFLRWRTVGDDVTYVVNRNINFTNVCVKRC
ncbi:MAG: 7,8-didemethyl-8-hydroxy-5-deazariboflavin synthase, partial [Acidobacteria bacterium]|nr:7,8-didemethyl-8-hydroxy-5-deazariboflavin synthase [Acidobacteriota bacterium]